MHSDLLRTVPIYTSLFDYEKNHSSDYKFTLLSPIMILAKYDTSTYTVTWGTDPSKKLK
jgi:hypothetical protein